MRAPAVTEKAFMQAVVDAAQVFGWKVFHPWTSVHSAAGWPDLFMVRGSRAVAVELKIGKRRPTPAQQSWLDALGCVEGIEAYVWYPDDWMLVEAVLR